MNAAIDVRLSTNAKKILKAFAGAEIGLKYNEIAKITGLPKLTIKSWIKNNIPNDRNKAPKIKQYYCATHPTGGQVYKLTELGKTLAKKLIGKQSPQETQEMKQDKQDIFSLLGVERKPATETQNVSTTSLGKYEELLDKIERKKTELYAAEIKLKEMISAVSKLHAVEQEIVELIGSPINFQPQPAKAKSTLVPSETSQSAFRTRGMLLNTKTAAMLDYIKENGPVTPAEIAKAARVEIKRIRVWIWNALNSRGDKAYIVQHDENDTIYLSAEGNEYLNNCKAAGMIYPKLTEGYKNIPCKKKVLTSIGFTILNLLEKEALNILGISERTGLDKHYVQQWCYNSSSGPKRIIERNNEYKYVLTEEGRRRLGKLV